MTRRRVTSNGGRVGASYHTAAIYARVSTGQQAEGLSLEAQEARCREYIKQRGWRAGKVYVDVQTGRTDDRTELTKLRRQLKRYAAVVVYKCDRIMRSTTHLYRVVEDCIAADCAFVSATEAVDVTTATGKMMLGILGVCAEWESDLISDRVRNRIAHQLETGRLPWRAQYGYDRNGGTPAINEEEAAVVRRIFAERAAGRTHSDIADGLVRDGIRKAIRGPGGVVRSWRPWKRSVVGDVLRNPAYIGSPYVGKQRRDGRRHHWMPKAEWEQAEGLLPAIIDQELWRAVQAQGLRGRKPTRPAYFRGLLICGACGDTWYVRSWGYAQTSYLCSGKHTHTCDLRARKETVVVNWFEAALAEVRGGPSGAQVILRDREMIEEEGELARERFERAQALALDGLLDQADLRTVKDELDQAEAVLAAGGHRAATPDELCAGVRECRRALRLGDRGKVAEANQALRRTLARIVVHSEPESVDVVFWGDEASG